MEKDIYKKRLTTQKLELKKIFETKKCQKKGRKGQFWDKKDEKRPKKKPQMTKTNWKKTMLRQKKDKKEE